MKNFRVRWVITQHPMVSLNIPKGYKFEGVDNNGCIIYLKEGVMQFRSIREAIYWVNAQNGINPPCMTTFVELPNDRLF